MPNPERAMLLLNRQQILMRAEPVSARLSTRLCSGTVTCRSESPLLLGRFGKSFGVHGWVKVISFTDLPESILDIQPWLIKKDGIWREIHFEDRREHISGIVVKLPGYDTPESVSKITNFEIRVWREQLPQLQSDEYYWTDLIGLRVINGAGISLGVVKELIATGANDVLVVVNGDKRLIPYISDVIQQVDLVDGTIHVDWEEDYI